MGFLEVKEWGSIKMIFQSSTLKPVLMVIGDYSALPLGILEENYVQRTMTKHGIQR